MPEPACYPRSHRISPVWRNGRDAPIFNEEPRLSVYEKERNLERDISGKVEQALPGVEVLAVELSGPERFTVYVDRQGGVDHALCEQVTRVLWDYLREYGIDVSSPGSERPLRKPEHFQRVLGREVKLKTAERSKLRGEVRRAGESTVTVAADGGEVDIPYDQIVRGNLIDERKQ